MATAAYQQAKERTTSPWAAKAFPYALALYAAISSLWGVGNTDIVDTDAARHAMNGAFVYDLLRTGNLLHPIDYAQQYYGHLPALSMPYHPPVFPAIEALFFALFGVKLLTARLAVALSAGACVVLLYRLIEGTLGNRVLAVCVSATMVSLATSQLVGRDVMLEYPAMALMLAALHCLHEWEGEFSMKSALGFAIFASAAFWTKQHAVLVGGIPPIVALLTGRWRVLFRKPALVALGLFVAAVGGYIFLSKQFHNAGIHAAATSTSDLGWIAKATLPSYFLWIKEDLVGMPGVFAACSIVFYALTLRKLHPKPFKLTMYWAWVISTAIVLADLGSTNNRYLFFIFPATLAIGYAWLFQGCARIWGERSAERIALGFAWVWFVSGFFVPPELLRGPGAAAAAVVQGQPTRILYAGEADGNFIFSVRVLDPKLQVTVIPGGKLPRTTFQRDELEAFCRQFGINWLILENIPIPHSWSNLQESTPAFLQLDRTIPLESTRFRWRTGNLRIFRVVGLPEAPGGVLKLPVWKLGGDIAVQL
jgi:4-amino-4-deoxy-L-arabinose transferase-like glycosyltransferase